MRTLLLSALVLLTACAEGPDPRQAKVDAGVVFAHRTFARVGTDAMTALSLGSIAEQGGTLVDFLAANAPEGLDLPSITMERPSAPWSIALREIDGPAVIIEGYGDSLSRPYRVDTVPLRRVARP